MKRQRFFLAAVATCAFVASYAVPCVCLTPPPKSEPLNLENPLPENPLVVSANLIEDDYKRLDPSSHLLVRHCDSLQSPRLIKLADGLNLRRLDLVGAQINNIILEDVDFYGCDFTRADLRQAYFVRCDFSHATLRDVKIDEYTRFIDCKFHNASFGGYDVQLYPREPFVASLLTVEQLKSTNSFSKKIKPTGHGNPGFYKSIHNWSAIPTMAFKDCADYDFTDIALQGEFRNLTAEQLKQTQNFQAGVYEHIAIGRSGDQRRLLDYKNFDFRKAILRNCLFRNVDLTGADFTDAVLYGCKFHERTIITLEQLQSTWNWKNGRVSLIFVNGVYGLAPDVKKAVEAQIAKEAAQATEAKASPEPQSETATAPETK